MKLKFDIDCTPEELRGFFGLPDVKPMQDAADGGGRGASCAPVSKALDPETMLKTWLPAGLKGFEQLQEMFFSQMGRGGEEIAVAVALRTPRLLLREWRDDGCRAVRRDVGRSGGDASYLPARPRRSEPGWRGRAPIGGARLRPVGRRAAGRGAVYRRRRAESHRAATPAVHPGGRGRLAAGAALLGPGLRRSRRRAR